MATVQLYWDSQFTPSLGVSPASQETFDRVWKVAFERALYPVLILSAIALHVWLTAGVESARYSLVTAAIALGFMAGVVALEHLAPFRADWNDDRGDLKADLVQTNAILPAATQLNQVALAAVAAWIAARSHGLELFPAQIPFVLQVGLALLIAELGYYWVHRLEHSLTALWAYHAVHHGAQRVYSLNAGRFHFLDAWFSTLVYLGPLLLLRVPAPVVALIATLNAVTGLMEHANIAFDAGFLNRVFNTAQLHRWHHAADVEASACNFGKVLSVWDQVFGTWSLPSQGEIGTVGLWPGQAPVPASFWGQAAYPWRSGR